MKYIKSFFRFIIWNIWLLRVKKRAKAMIEDQDELVSKFGSILFDTAKRRINIEDKIWVNNIESLRKELNKTQREIVVTDFGAGGRNQNRTESQMHIGQVNNITIAEINSSSQSPFCSLLLFKIISEFKPKIALELGTSLGISAAYQAAALTVYSGGKLVTMEGSESLVEKSRENFTYLGLLNIEIVEGRFLDNLHNVLEENKPIDYVFIDGHHNQNALIQYFEIIIPYLSEKSIIIFDDISWSKGMKTAWKRIVGDPNTKLIFDLKEIGVCFLDKQRLIKRVIKI